MLNFLTDTNLVYIYTKQFLVKLTDNEQLLVNNNTKLFSIDVKALYPSIKPEFVPVAVRDALDECSTWSDSRKDAIVELVKFSISHAVVHFRDKW